MSWIVAIALALGAFALAAFALGVARQGWTSFAAALALGLAGYALQASPGLPGAPAAGAARPEGVDWAYVEARHEMVRQGRILAARGVWASTLESAAEDAAGRAALEERLARLDQIIAGGGAVPPQNAPSR